MNRVFRVIWNAATGAWQAVTEIAKGAGKTKSSKTSLPALAAGAFVMLSALTLAGQAHAADVLPTGGVVTSGGATISTSGSAMTINQSTAKMVADWQSFSIGAGNSVTFNQPNASSVALNRVLGADVSVIQGALKANGQVFLLNPNGILFTPTAQVNVGALVASTLNIKTEDFLSGNYKFDSAAGTASGSSAIINQGNITATGDGTAGGTIALIAAKITNTGTLTANAGHVLLGAGSQVMLDMGGPVKLQVTHGAIDALIESGGAIQADGGTVLLTAKAAGDLAASVINHTGLIQAQTLATGEKGQITLLGEGELITISGTLDASAPHNGGAAGAASGTGGRIVATGTRVLVKDGAHFTASGTNGGGEVLVGGSYQNSDTSVYQATGTVVEKGALLEANATDNGNGGTVVAWSDVSNAESVTKGYGSFYAKGGAGGGDGGRVEVSGHWLDVEGADLSAAAVNGKAGGILFDPSDILIQSNAFSEGTLEQGNPNQFVPNKAVSILTPGLISEVLNAGNNLTVLTTSAFAGAGDIYVNEAASWFTATGGVLTLNAVRNIYLNANLLGAGVELYAGGSVRVTYGFC